MRFVFKSSCCGSANDITQTMMPVIRDWLWGNKHYWTEGRANREQHWLEMRASAVPGSGKFSIDPGTVPIGCVLADLMINDALPPFLLQ
jgi:hypothetical protein